MLSTSAKSLYGRGARKEIYADDATLLGRAHHFPVLGGRYTR